MTDDTFSWPSGSRDTTQFPSIKVTIDPEIRDHLKAICRLDGVDWNNYEEQLTISGLNTDSRIRTYRKLYERLGLIFKDGDKIRLSRLGRSIRDLEQNIDAAAQSLVNQIRVYAIDVLARYQLRNPIDGPDLPISCDVQPYVCIWKAMRVLQNKISFEEMNRVILHIASMSQLDEAIQKIGEARAKTKNYNYLTRDQMDRLLGPQVHTEQESARIAPWFSLAGWGGLIIERKQDNEGFRHLVPLALDAIDEKLADIPKYYNAHTEDEWLDYYIGDVGVREKESARLYNIPDEKQRTPGGTNIILYGVPGSGKSWTINNEYCADEDRMERVVFHPDYMYSDFIGQILPVIRHEKVHYEFVPGPFTKLLRKAYLDEENEYYLIIEEINRGNAPAIFGDVFHLLDRITSSQNQFQIGTSEYAITNGNIAKYVYRDENHKVRIPSNLSIIGTMNTSDQNVFTLDTAFQRRWRMQMIPNTFETHRFAESPILDTEVTWKMFCNAINDEIQRLCNVTSSEDKRLGAYFVSADDLKWYSEEDDDSISTQLRTEAKHKNSRFAEKVLKYLCDDAFRFSHNETFNTRLYNSLELIIKVFCSKRKNDRFIVFSENLRNKIFAHLN